jgi:hypothetical protein
VDLLGVGYETNDALIQQAFGHFARGKFAGETRFTAKGENYKESITICNASDLFTFVLK